MIIPKIDGGKPTIVYTDGYKPVSVYVDGELQTPISAIPETAQGASNISNILTEYDKAIKNLEISGTTSQSGTPTPEAPIPVENANTNGMSAIVHGNNLFNQDAMLSDNDCTKAIYDGYECIKIAPTKVRFDFPLEIPINSTFRMSFSAAFPNDINTYWRFIYDDGTTSNAFVSRAVGDPRENFVRFRPSNLAATTAVGKLFNNTTKKIIGIRIEFYSYNTYTPMYIKDFMVNIGTEHLPYEPYFREEISIPTSVEVDGTTVPLLMSEWDKLTVDRIANKVIYTEGSWQRAMRGTENWFEGYWSESNGYGKQYNLAIGRDYKVTPVTYRGYSNGFALTRWVNEAPNNSFIVSSEATSDTDKGIIQVYTDKVSPVADFKAMLAEKYAEGNPLIFLVKREASNVKQHDITNTDFGQALLSLNLQRNQTNILEIVSNLSAPQVPTNLTYYIWGGRNENESNA